MSEPKRHPTERDALVCFDFEGQWGMPFAARYDLEASTHRILDVLARHRAHATFFVVGALAIEHQDAVGAICAAGHEIALHGWQHEDLQRLTPPQLARFGDGLDESAAAIETLTGKAPAGFRAPYLLAPRFFDAAVYELLAARGYCWASNRELRHVVELFSPDRFRSQRPWRFLQSHPRLLDGRLAHTIGLALNANVYLANRPRGAEGLRWLHNGCPPFYRGQILEIPLYSPMDCDLLGVPDPSTPTPSSTLEFARFAMEACLAREGRLTMLTFHDWIVSSANRLQLLDSVLSFMVQADVRPTSVQERWQQLKQLAAEAQVSSESRCRQRAAVSARR